MQKSITRIIISITVNCHTAISSLNASDFLKSLKKSRDLFY
jgi:hypothetical protein